MTSLGIDIGGTAIKAGLYRDDQLEPLPAVATPRQPDEIVQAVIDIAREHRAVEATGVAVAAFVDASRRSIALSPNIDWADRPLADEVEAAIERPIAVENDANAAGFAEYARGAGARSRSMVMLTLGTGVGGAVILDGDVVTGPRGMAAELGHIIVEPGGERCGCGQRGCVETVSSGTAMMSQVARKLGRDVSQPAALEHELAQNPSLRDEVVSRAARGLVLALANLQAVLDPEVVVIGGGVTDRLGASLFDAIDRQRAHLLEGRRSDAFPDIRAAQLGNTAGVIGAALLAQQAAQPAR